MSDPMPPPRAEILRAVIPGAALPLWVPLLTPYRPGTADVDVERLRRHQRVLRGHTPLWMVAGSTGDGWELDDRQFGQLLDAVTAPEADAIDGHLLFALLAADTEQALGRLERLHEALGTSPNASFEDNLHVLRARGWVGICVAPPVGEDVDQLRIAHHFEEIGRRARMPMAVYEIPQVTGCRIAAETFRALVGAHEEIVLFKDSSGEDRLAGETSPLNAPVLVRGAESDYATSLRAGGGLYDGLLLGSANNFGQELAAIVRATLSGHLDAAKAHSSALQKRVADLFEAVAPVPVGNAFANANRAVDHVLAHGHRATDVEPPALFDGSVMAPEVIAAVDAILDRDGVRPLTGYLDL
ncbi:MAG TPA: dihydrodipicolinate synthase family protein [Candidatus Krumholzibacteria bacterium]|nr:dihydrodipicolinate synthase family protein [Candidatus Krumholzibacteria bacterium]